METKSLKQFFSSEAVLKKMDVVTNNNGKRYAQAVLLLASSNKDLQNAQPDTVLQAALTAAILRLDLLTSEAYIVPYVTKSGSVAQFQISWRGFYQLAIRTGKYKYINVTDVREGELVRTNRLTGIYEFDWITDEKEREKRAIIGYVAYFQMVTGLEKMLFMTIDQIKQHAKTYSQSYKKGFGKWVDDFDAMAKKTVIKLLLSRYAEKDSDMLAAIQNDQAVKYSEDEVIYVDNGDENINVVTDDANIEQKEVKTSDGDVINVPGSLF